MGMWGLLHAAIVFGLILFGGFSVVGLSYAGGWCKGYVVNGVCQSTPPEASDRPNAAEREAAIEQALRVAREVTARAAEDRRKGKRPCIVFDQGRTDGPGSYWQSWVWKRCGAVTILEVRSPAGVSRTVFE